MMRCQCGRPAEDFERVEREGSMEAIASAVAQCPPQPWCAMRELARTAANSTYGVQPAAKPTTLCSHCHEMRSCCHLFRSVPRVEPDQLELPPFVKDAKTFVARLPMSTAKLLNKLPVWLGEAGCAVFVDRRGRSVPLDLDPLQEAGEDWLDEWRQMPVENVRRVRKVAVPRVWPMLTILRFRYAGNTLLWGIRPANDNAPLPQNDV